MKEVTIWFRRIIKLAEIDLNNYGIEKDDLVQIIRRIRPIPPEFSFISIAEGERKRKWYDIGRLKIFIELGITLEIYQKKSIKGKELIYKTKMAEGVLDIGKRLNILINSCEKVINSKYGGLNNLLENIDEIESPATAKTIARKLKLGLTRSDLIIFEAVLQIYGDISEKLEWTGKITFGRPYKISNLKISDGDLKIIEVIYKTHKTSKTKGKKELKKRIKEGEVLETHDSELYSELERKYRESEEELKDILKKGKK